MAGSPKTKGKINKVEEQSKLNGVMLLPWRREGGGKAAKASKGGLYYNGVSSLLCYPRLPSLFLRSTGCLSAPPLLSSRAFHRVGGSPRSLLRRFLGVYGTRW